MGIRDERRLAAGKEALTGKPLASMTLADLRGERERVGRALVGVQSTDDVGKEYLETEQRLLRRREEVEVEIKRRLADAPTRAAVNVRAAAGSRWRAVFSFENDVVPVMFLFGVDDGRAIDGLVVTDIKIGKNSQTACAGSVSVRVLHTAKLRLEEAKREIYVVVEGVNLGDVSTNVDVMAEVVAPEAASDVSLFPLPFDGSPIPVNGKGIFRARTQIDGVVTDVLAADAVRERARACVKSTTLIKRPKASELRLRVSDYLEVEVENPLDRPLEPHDLMAVLSREKVRG